MAKWAKKMYYATGATVILTLFALFAIVRTLHHTRRAADYTKGMLDQAIITTSAAIEANKTTRLVGQAQIRPWVLYKGILANPEEKMGTRSVNISFMWKNFGGTPAIKMQMQTEDFKFVPFNSKNIPTFKLSPFTGAESVLGPTDEVNGWAKSLSGDELQKFINNEIAIIWYGCLRYYGTNDLIDTDSYETEVTIRIKFAGFFEVEGKKYPKLFDEVVEGQNKTV